jgi:hypothetical protein
MMSSFLSYSTSDPTTGQTPLQANAVTTIGPFQTGTSAKIVGSCFVDQAGTLSVQQTMDGSYQLNAENGSPEYGNVFWDVVQNFTMVANTPQTIDIDIIGPIAQVVFTNGGSAQGTMRIFLRAMGNRAAS